MTDAFRLFLVVSLFVFNSTLGFGQQNAITTDLSNYIGISQNFLNSQSNTDSAFLYYEKAYSYWRKLDEKERKKLSKSSKIDDNVLRKLKNKIKTQLLEEAFASNSLEKLEAFEESFPRLPSKQQEAFVKMRNKLLLKKARTATDFKIIDSLYKKYESDIQYYDPGLTASFDSLIFNAFFAQYDETVLYNLLYFIDRFPGSGNLVDQQLAIAFEQTPHIGMIEQYILKPSPIQFPKTVAKIYPYYKAWGKVGDLMEYARKYPDFAQNETFAEDINRLKQAQYKLVSGHEEHLSDYVQLMAPGFTAFHALQQMIAKDIEEKNWDQAIDKVEKHIKYFLPDTSNINKLLSLLKAPEEEVNRASFDSIYVNTVLQEYSPVVSSDGNKVFFCRRGQGAENIYTAKKEETGWSKTFSLIDINQDNYNEAPLAISGDGNTLLLFEEGIVKVSELSKAGWSKPKAFFPPKLQSEWQGGTSISSDKNVVIFTARRPDRVGIPKNPVNHTRGEDENNDLYISIKQKDGAWGYPVNLGTMINTPYEERSPFLHPDMRTLYFSSNGHGGLGDLDVYKTTRIGEGWTEWTNPINLGKSINTEGRDWGYRISTDGQFAYYAAEVEGKQSELFKLTLPEAFRPEDVSTINGRLVGLNGKPIEAKLIIEDLERDSIITSVTPKPLTGEYYLTLPKGKLYGYRIESVDHFPIAGHIDLRDSDQPIHNKEDIIVPSVEELSQDSLNIRLNNLFFDYDKASLQPASFSELNRVARFVKEHELLIEIAGHTDNMGTEDYNLDLSERRAKTVKAYLIKKGCNATQINSKGYGFAQPIDDNSTEEGRAMNRRVEIRFNKSYQSNQ